MKMAGSWLFNQRNGGGITMAAAACEDGRYVVIANNGNLA
jgi:hypothetical protein